MEIKKKECTQAPPSGWRCTTHGVRCTELGNEGGNRTNGLEIKVKAFSVQPIMSAPRHRAPTASAIVNNECSGGALPHSECSGHPKGNVAQQVHHSIVIQGLAQCLSVVLILELDKLSKLLAELMENIESKWHMWHHCSQAPPSDWTGIRRCCAWEETKGNMGKRRDVGQRTAQQKLNRCELSGVVSLKNAQPDH